MSADALPDERGIIRDVYCEANCIIDAICRRLFWAEAEQYEERDYFYIVAVKHMSREVCIRKAHHV